MKCLEDNSELTIRNFLVELNNGVTYGTGLYYCKRHKSYLNEIENKMEKDPKNIAINFAKRFNPNYNAEDIKEIKKV